MTNTPAAKSMSSAARCGIVLLLMGFAALGHFNRIGITVAGSEVFISKLHISPVRMGWVYNAFLTVYMLGMLPGGWLIDRIGAGRTLTLFALAMGLFIALTGVLGWVTTSPDGLWIGLLIIRSFAGLCSAPLHPGAAHVVSDLIPERRQATANGIVIAGALVGIAFCYPLFGWLIDRLGWPWAFIASGATLMAYGVFWHFFALPSLPLSGSKFSAIEDKPKSSASWSLLKNHNLWLIALSYAAFGYFQYLFFYWIEYYFEKVLHVPPIESRRASSYVMLAQAGGMAFGGLCNDSICKLLGAIRGRRSIVMTGMGLGALFAMVGITVQGQWNVTLCLAISLGALGMCEGVFWTTATDIGGKSRGFAGAFMNTGGNIGGLISPVLTPYIAVNPWFDEMAAQHPYLPDKLGWYVAIAVACLVSFAGGLLWFFINLPAATPARESPVE